MTHAISRETFANMRYPKYAFYVVACDSGLVLAGADFKADATEMRRDLPMEAKRTCVLTRAGVLRKYGAVKWA